MVWLTWRQHRTELVAMLVVAALVAAATVILAALAQHARLELGVDTCVPLPTTNMNCFDLDREWQRRVGPARFLFFAFYVAPALVAAYIGGPLFARELERGTHRLAWTQGVGRVRWVATKLGVVLAFALTAGVVLALVGGQTRHLMGVSGYRPWDTFDQEGPALLSFIVFGLTAGAFIGAWRRQILAGMFFGLLIFSLVRGVVIFELRPSYEPPVAVPFAAGPYSFPFGGPLGTAGGPLQERVPSDAWLIGTDAVDGQGRPVPQEHVRALLDEFARAGCRGPQGCDSVSYLAARDVHQRALYQPADRYWRFQLTEAGIYLVLSAVFVALTLWVVRRRDA